MSRIRTSTLSPSKQFKSSINKQYYEPPLEKQFIAYSTVAKESNWGASSHQRFLLLDSRSKTLRYYSTIPDPPPSPSQQIPEGKETIEIKKTKGFSFKSTRTNIGKVRVEWTNLNSEKKSWILTFSSNTLMNEWVVVVNEILKDGHLKPENRPPSSSRRQTKEDTLKYMTPFMKQIQKTQVHQRSGPSPKMMKIEKIEQKAIRKQEVQNEEWITKKLSKKEEEIINNRQNHDKISSPPNKKQSGDSKINIEIKMQNSKEKLVIREEFVLREEANTKEKLNLKEEIDEKVNNEVISNSLTKKKIGWEEELLNSNMNRKQGKHEELLNSNMNRKQGKHEELLNSNMNRKQGKHEPEEDGRKRQQFQEYVGAINRYSEGVPIEKRKEKPQFNEHSSYLQIYTHFIKKCENFVPSLIDSLSQIVESARKNATPKLHVFNDVLIVEKENVIYNVHCLQRNNLWYSSQLKMKQYSSIVYYIIKLAENKSMFAGCKKVMPIPYLIIEYMWYTISCKLKVPPLVSEQISDIFDATFKVPSKKWKYHEVQKGLFIVDFAVEGFEVDSTLQKNIQAQIVAHVFNSNYMISGLRDLIDDISFYFSINVDTNLILMLLKCKQSKKRAKTFSMLISILKAINCCEIIKKKLSDHIQYMDRGQLYETMDKMINDCVFNENAHIFKQGNQKTFSALELNVESNKIEAKIVMTTLVYLLGLEFDRVNSYEICVNDNFNANQKFVLKFAKQTHAFNIQSYSAAMKKVKGLMLQQKQQGSENKHQIFEAMQRMIQEFDEEMIENEGKSSYYNLRHRIRYEQSLFQPHIYLGSSQYDKDLDLIIGEEPPLGYSYLTAVNCIKWVIKLGNQHQLVTEMLKAQINRAKFWSGLSCYTLLFYELYSVYSNKICDYLTAIHYGQLATDLAIDIYGEWAPESIERIFQLGTILFEAEQFDQAIEYFQKALILIHSKPQDIGDEPVKQTAQLTVLTKMAKSFLAMGDIEKCLQICEECLQIKSAMQQFPEISQFQQFQILSLIIRCYEVTKQQQKLIQIINVVSYRLNSVMDSKNNALLQQILRVCLSPYIQCRIKDPSRRSFIFNKINQVELQHQSRSSKKQYCNFLASQVKRVSLELKIQQMETEYSLIEKLVNTFARISMFQTNDQTDTMTLKVIEAVGGVLGFAYLKNCFLGSFN